MEFFGYIVLSLVILLLMVLIHEAGHYTAAKILGFTVDEFSVGFGPKIFSKRRKNGELFSLRMLPLGGYCAFYGDGDDEPAQQPDKPENQGANAKSDANADSDVKTDLSADTKNLENSADTASVKSDAVASENSNVQTDDVTAESADTQPRDDLFEHVMKEQNSSSAPHVEEEKPIRLDKNGLPAKTFFEQKPWKRIIVLLGGVLFNFISAFVFSLIYIWAVGFPVPQIADVYTHDGIPYCFVEKGDVILSVDGEEINILKSFSDISEGIEEGETVTLTVDRGEIVEIEATKQKITVVSESGETTEYVGFGFTSESVFIGNNAANAFTYCVPYTFKLSWAIIGSFFDLFTGKAPITSVSGPVGSISLMAQLSIADWRNILVLLPLLASNLAIFNLLPFPALDGAHVVFTVIEWIRRKPINRKVEGMIHFVGMIVLLLFVLIVDILSFAL